MNYFDWIGKWSQYTPDRIAVAAVDTGRSYSFRELHELSSKMGNYLREELSIKKGDRIPVLAHHSPEYLILFLAAQRLGAILVPLNYRSPSFELISCLNDLDSAFFLADLDFFRNKAQEIEKETGLKCHAVNCIFSEAEAHRNVLQASEIEPEQPIFIFYTSGTTGKPKGVLYTNKMLFWNSLNTSVQLEITSQDYTLNALPPYHTSGWNVLLLPMLHRGARVDFIRRFKAGKVLSYIKKHDISLFLAIPTMLRMMAKNKAFEEFNPAKLRYIVVGGENLSIPLIDTWAKRGILLRQGYGLTEAGPCITSLHHHDALWKKGSIGKANFYVDYKIINNKNIEVKTGETGELCIRGNIVTPGYWNNSAYSIKKIKEGWFFTGDMVRMDSEGFMYVIGRKDQQYISGGVNIFPKEIEELLLKQELVKEVAVIGVEDEKWGEAGIAFVVPNNLRSSKELCNILRKYLASYKIPREIIFLENLPKSGIGKIDRNKLKSDYNYERHEKKHIV